HDRVLLHDSDEHDQADETVNVQIHLEEVKSDQGSEDGRRQAGQNRQRVDVALIKDAQHDVDHEDGDAEQQGEILYGIFKLACGSLERSADRGRYRESEFLDLTDGISQRNARLQIEGERHRGQLAKMVNRLRTRIL